MAKKRKKKKTGPVQKQKATVYTMMLIVSFLALVLSCVLMYLEMERYDHDIKAKSAVGDASRAATVQPWRNMA